MLKRLHELTQWKIVNRYADIGSDIVFTCEAGACHIERFPGKTACSNCDERWPTDDIDLEHSECPTCMMGRADYLVTLEPDGAAIINT